VIGFWILFVVAIVAIVMATRSHSAASQRRGVFSGLATRFKGQFTVSAWGGKASLWFRHGDVPVLIRRFYVSEAIWKRAAVTQFSVPWPDGRMQLQICARDPAVARRFSSRDKEIDSALPEFNAAFSITSRRPDFAKRFLTSDVLGYANRFIWPYKEGFRLKLQSGRLIIETREGVHTARDPVCSEVLVTMVVCNRCRTPHHEDCWTYYGGCSVYGCRETAYEHLLQAEVIPPEDVK
jgi:hypothetical protein